MKRKRNKVKIDVAVLGGGASGILAAIFAARGGKSVAILEKNPRIGKKILATGNGRCNFTNINAKESDYNSDFVKDALTYFPPGKTIEFFEELGLLSREEDEGRVYPRQEQATAVLDVLRLELSRLSVKVFTEFDGDRIEKTKDGFKIFAKNRSIEAKKVIIATGGMASPKSGSDGAGYKLLETFGHTKTKLVPSLVQLKTEKSVGGVRAYGKVTTLSGKSNTGEIQFNNYGISGIPVFSVAKYVNSGETVFLDLMPDFTEDEVVGILKKRPKQTMDTYLIGILNKALAHMILKECGMSPLSRESDTLSDKEILKIAKIIKSWSFKVTGMMPWDNAQVTAGGIELSEINPETMESKLAGGIYVTGELLDIDGPCGGYNLQWAWSSGALAGSEASK